LVPTPADKALFKAAFLAQTTVFGDFFSWDQQKRMETSSQEQEVSWNKQMRMKTFSWKIETYSLSRV
jgi:hypothetical protein